MERITTPAIATPQIIPNKVHPKAPRSAVNKNGVYVPEIKKKIILKMEQALISDNINLKLCCEKEVLDALPATTTVTESSCIPNDLLVELFGGNLSLKKDTGQRVQKGCGCKVSVDIGSYHHHPCYHNCLFCYANPASR